MNHVRLELEDGDVSEREREGREGIKVGGGNADVIELVE